MGTKYTVNLGHTGFIEPKKIQAIKNRAEKPFGGLWASRESHPGWRQWCEAEQPDWLSNEDATITMKQDARILVIDSENSFNNTFNRFSYRFLDYFGDEVTYFNYEDIAKHYDAIEFRMDEYHGLRKAIWSLDCDSVLILNKDAIESIENPEHITSYETGEPMFNPSKEELMQLMEQMHNDEHKFRAKPFLDPLSDSKDSLIQRDIEEQELFDKRTQLANKIIDAIRTNDPEYSNFLTKYVIGVGYSDYIHIVAPNGVSFSFETDILDDKPDLLYQFIKDNIKETYFEPEVGSYEKFLGSPMKLLNVNSGIGNEYRSYLATKFSEFLPKDYLFEYKPGQFLHPKTARIYSIVAEMNKENARIYMEQQGYTQDQIDFVISENGIQGYGYFGLEQKLIDAGLMKETDSIDPIDSIDPDGWRQAKDSLTFQFEDTLTQDTDDGFDPADDQ